MKFQQYGIIFSRQREGLEMGREGERRREEGTRKGQIKGELKGQREGQEGGTVLSWLSLFRLFQFWLHCPDCPVFNVLCSLLTCLVQLPILISITLLYTLSRLSCSCRPAGYPCLSVCPRQADLFQLPSFHPPVLAVMFCPTVLFCPSVLSRCLVLGLWLSLVMNISRSRHCFTEFRYRKKV